MTRANSRIKRILVAAGAVIAVGCVATMAGAQPSISRSVIASGGTHATSASFALAGTVGQPAVGTSMNTNWQIFPGYWYRAVAVPSGVPPSPAKSYRLEQNYPNPFNPRTTITFSLAREARARLRVFDATGAQVMTVIDRSMPAGVHRVEVDASGLASGVYFYQLDVPGFRQARKLVLVK